MRRMRCFARGVVVAGLLVAAFSASAGTLYLIGPVPLFEPGTAGHILAMTFAAIMGLFAFAKAFNSLLVQPLLEKMESQQKAMIAAGLVALKESFDNLLAHHVAANDPHPVASDRMHEPLYAADKKIIAMVEEVRLTQLAEMKRLARLIAAHNATVGDEQGGPGGDGGPLPCRRSDLPGTGFSSARGRHGPVVVENGGDE